MEKYNYFEAVKDDVMEYIEKDVNLADYASREELEEELNETLWTVDSVTGNASGSYTFNTWKAEENLAHNWDEIEETAAEFGMEAKISDGYEYGAEWWDVSIRCRHLAGAIAAVLYDLEESGAFEEIEEEKEEEITA